MVKAYNWQQDLLKGMPGGRSYDDKLNNAVKAMGGTKSDAQGFKNFLDNQSRVAPRRGGRQKSTTVEDWDSQLQQSQAQHKAQVKKPNSNGGLLNDILHPVQTFKHLEQSAQKKATNAGLGLLSDFLGNLSNKGKVNKKTVKDSALGALTQFGVNKAAENVSHTKNKEVNRDLVRLSPLSSAANEYQKNLIGKGLSQYDQTGRGVAGKTTDFLADMGSYALPGGLAAKGVKAAGLGVKAGAKGLPLLGQYLRQGALVGGALGGLDVATREGLNGKNYNWKDNLAHVGLMSAIGAGAEGLIGGTGHALKVGSENTVKKALNNNDEKLSKQFADILNTGKKSDLPTSKPIYGSLPDRLRSLPNERKLPDFSNAKPIVDNPNESIISKHYGVDTPVKPKDLVDEAPREYWQKRYEDFAKYVHKNYDTNKLTKEGLDELWTHFAKPNEPVNLEQLAELAYKGYKPSKTIDTNQVWDKLGNRKPVSNNAMKKMGISRLEPPTKTNGLQSLVENIRPVKNEVASTAEKIAPQVENGGALKRTTQQSEPIPKEQSNGLEKAIQQIKDIKPPQTGTTDLYRLSERLPSEMKHNLVSNLDKAKQNYVNHQEQLTKDLWDKVVSKNGLGIKQGSKESALVQDFGEKTLGKKYLRKQGIDPKDVSPEELDAINLEQLKKVSPNKWEKIVQADNYFRNAYDKLIEQVNKVRSDIYPNQEDKLVPRRNDYYHHFKELNGFEGVKNLFDTPANIDPHLEGLSPFTQPKTKFQGFMQKRGVGKYKSDAVGGYLKYAKASAHSINIDPVIPVVRNTAKQLADATTNTKNANNIIKSLNYHANDLAGKTNPYFDRTLQDLVGRKSFAVANWANSHVKGNTILGNLSSALGQIGNVPLGAGKAKFYTIPGLKDTLSLTANTLLRGEKNAPIYKSDFLKERFTDKYYRKFDQKLIQQPKRMAVWLLETADKAGSTLIWNSMYRKAVGKGIADPIKYADNEARKIIAGRGIGEVPLLQKSKTIQMLAPFTLEVGNQWKVLREMVGAKDAAGILTFLVASYGLNKAIEQVRGSGVSYDPIDAIIDGYNKTDGTKAQKLLGSAGSLAGETIGNIPGGNLITNLVNTNAKVPYTDKTIKDIFVGRDPNRFGSGLVAAKLFTDPYNLLPFGGNQAKKTVKGIDAIRKEGVYNSKGKLQYPVKQSVLKDLQLLTMGPSSTSEARSYYDKKTPQPLSEVQTRAYERLKGVGSGIDFFNTLRNSNLKPSDKQKFSRIESDKKLSDAEKLAKLQALLETLRKK